jgi:hypothetical protein
MAWQKIGSSIAWRQGIKIGSSMAWHKNRIKHGMAAWLSGRRVRLQKRLFDSKQGD